MQVEKDIYMQAKGQRDSTLCLEKTSTFTICCYFYIHSSNATIFGTNVAQKAGNQNVFYFPTSPN